MGHPRRLKKKYSKPRHPWQKDRIEVENELKKKYGFRTKKEIWKMNSFLSKMKDLSKKLIAAHGSQADIEKVHLIKKASSYGLVKPNAKIEDVLAITLEDVLNRRLQTIIVKKKFGRSMLQARQFITHGHVMVKDKTINSPSYLVKLDEESRILFRVSSAFNSEEHPARKLENVIVNVPKDEKPKAVST